MPDNVDVIRRWWDGFNEDGFPPLALCDEQITITNPPQFPIRGPFEGHDGVRQWAREVWDVFSDFHMEIEEISDVGDGATVVCVQRVRGRMRHTGLPTNVQWAAVITVQDGRMLRAQGYMRRAEARRAAGLPE